MTPLSYKTDRHRELWACWLALALSFALIAPTALANRFPDLTPCELSAAAGQVTVSARCGHLQVPENPDDLAGRSLSLPFAVIPARGRPVLPDPVVFLAGGPGQSALETAPFLRAALHDLNRNRDLLFLDQRGTGGANPLHCRAAEEEDPWRITEPAAMLALLDRCRADWDADLRFYTTSDGARDLEALRRHLGYDQLNLIGGSYGTRMAQVYLRNHPERVRSVILDGVAPTRLALGAEHGQALDQSLMALFDRCQADAACAQAFPDVHGAFSTLKERYSDWQEGPEVTLLLPRSGESISVPFTRSVLAGALRFLAYSPSTQMLLPLLVHEAAHSGDPSRLASQAIMVTESLQDSIAVGLNFAVGCAEDWPVWPPVGAAADTLLGHSLDELYALVCEQWPAGARPDDFHTPFDSDVPILLLSGEFDPVTPPSYGDEAAAQFSNSRHLIAPGRGHIVLPLPCISRISTQFVDTLDLDALDTDCLEALGPEPFFVQLTGPQP